MYMLPSASDTAPDTMLFRKIQADCCCETSNPAFCQILSSLVNIIVYIKREHFNGLQCI